MKKVRGLSSLAHELAFVLSQLFIGHLTEILAMAGKGLREGVEIYFCEGFLPGDDPASCFGWGPAFDQIEDVKRAKVTGPSSASALRVDGFAASLLK